MPNDDAVIGRRTATGGAWAVGARLISRVLDFCSMVVLARVLRPRDFGLVAIAMAVIYIVEAALELPLSQALVRLKDVDAEHYDTAFTLGLLRGVTLSLGLCLISVPFARFYADPRLLPLICVLSLAPATRGMVSPRLADRSRRLDFAPDFYMEFSGKFLAFATAISLALLTRSYWAIAAGTVVSPAVATIVSYALAPYRPRLSLSRIPAFSGFLGWITAAQVISSINWQADRLLLGKIIARAEMGLFTAANDTANVPLSAFLGPIMRPLLSAFSAVRDNNTRLIHSYQGSATAIVTLGLPILLGESLLARSGIQLLLGPHWAGSVVFLRWLALSIVPSLFAAPLGPLVMAFGRTQIFLKRNLFELCIKLPLVIVGALKFGFMGVIAARGVSEVASVFYCMAVVRRLTGLSIRQQLLNPWRSIVSSAVMVLALGLILPGLNRLPGTLATGVGLVFAIVTGTIVYCMSLLSLWYAADCPPGLEAMLIHKMRSLLQTRRPAAEVV